MGIRGKDEKQPVIKNISKLRYTRRHIHRGYYTAARRYDFLSSSGENKILRTSAASE